MALTGADNAAQSGDNFKIANHTGGFSDTAPPTGFQDQFQQHIKSRFAGQSTDSQPGEPVLMAQNGGSSSVLSGFMGYVGDATYIGLAASAFGSDVPGFLQLQTNATRFFQEKILKHHAIENPQVWAAMGDALMLEEDMAARGIQFKPVKLGTLNSEVKREKTAEEKAHGKELEHDGQEANAIIKDITSGLKSPFDYILAARYLYAEAVRTADDRADQKTDGKDEKRMVGRLKILSGETDRTDAFGTRNGSIGSVADVLGGRVSYRLDEAHLLNHFAGVVPAELGWAKEANDLTTRAKQIYDLPPLKPGEQPQPGLTPLAEPVRMRLHREYSDTLTDKPPDAPKVVRVDDPNPQPA